MMPIRKITVFFVFILSLAACDKTTNATHEDISQMDYAALTDFLAHETIPADSFPRAIARYAMLSRVHNDFHATLSSLDRIYKEQQSRGAGKDLLTDISLGKAIVTADRLPDSIVCGYVCAVMGQMEHGVAPSSVITRYTMAAYATLLSGTETSNGLTAELCRKAINYTNLHSDVQERPEIYLYLGQASYENGDMKTSMATLSKALELAQTTGNTTQEARVYAILSRGFRDQGLFLQEKMTAEKAFNLSRTIPIGETKCLAARVMGWAYEDRQQLDSALIFLNLAYEISDSVHMHSKAKDILENDINRLRQHGCRQPDSMFAARAQALQEYTKVLIDINKAETLKDNVEPQISRNRAIMFYAIGICLAVCILSLIGFYFFRKHQKRIQAEKDAHLEGITARLRNITSQYRSTSERLEEVRERLSTAEEYREQLARQIREMENKLTDKEDELQETKTRLSNKQAFITSLQEEHKEQEERLQEINRRFAHKEFNLAEAVSNPRHFARDFLAVHPHFELALKERSSNISSHDVLLCILIVLDVSKEDIADIMKIRPESLNVARHRLRSKLGLTRYDNLYTILRSHL